MTGLESIGAVVGSIFAGGIFTFLFIGKIVNRQVTKSFEHSVNGDEEGNLGLRSSLKELRSDVKGIAMQVNSIAQEQAGMTKELEGRNKLCLQIHTEVDRRLGEIMISSDKAGQAADKALQMSRNNADELANLR